MEKGEIRKKSQNKKNDYKIPHDTMLPGQNKKEKNRSYQKNKFLSPSSSKTKSNILNKLNDKHIKTEPNNINQKSQQIKSVQKPRSNPFTQLKKVETQTQVKPNVNANTIDSKEVKEKIEFDEKTIKSFMPYFEKNMNYTKKLAKSEIKTIMLYEKKVDGLMNLYTFTERYLFFIVEVFTKISHPFYYVLSLTYLRDIKPYLAYFKNLSTILETFSDSLKSLGQTIKHPSNEEKEIGNMKGLMNVEFDLNNSIEKLNLIYSDIFSIISNNLKEKVFDKPLYNKVDTVEPKFWENLNEMAKLIVKISHRREKLEKKYKKEYEPMFLYFKDKKEKQSPELYNDLVCMKDFLFIEYELISYCNKAFIKIGKFLEDIELLYNNSSDLFCDYLEILKTMIKIYYDENRFIMKPDVLSSGTISNLESLIQQDIRKNIEKKFSIKNIIEFSKDPNLRNEMNHLLLNYRDILLQCKIVKDKNNIIDEITNFNLQSFKSTKYFFSFLKDLVPPILKFNFQNVIQLKLTVKRDPGILQKWRNTLLVVTHQGHILFLEESSLKNPSDKSNESEIKVENESKINEKKKKLKITDYIIKDELTEGILPNKLVYMYLKTSYGIMGNGKKDDKFLFQIWSYFTGNKKGKQLTVDALTQENLTKIINILNDNNDVNLTQINK